MYISPINKHHIHVLAPPSSSKCRLGALLEYIYVPNSNLYTLETNCKVKPTIGH